MQPHVPAPERQRENEIERDKEIGRENEREQEREIYIERRTKRAIKGRERRIKGK